jgi:hypothetical protein
MVLHEEEPALAVRLVVAGRLATSPPQELTDTPTERTKDG